MHACMIDSNDNDILYRANFKMSESLEKLLFEVVSRQNTQPPALHGSKP